MNKLLQFLQKPLGMGLVLVLVFGFAWMKKSGPSLIGGSYEKDFDYNESIAYEEAAYDDFRSMSGVAMVAESEPFMPSPNADVSPQDADQKLIRTGYIDLHVDDVREASETIDDLVAGWDGRVTYSDISKGWNAYYGSMTVQVPAEKFADAMDGLREIALLVNSESTSVDDVTSSYVDLEARLNNAKAEEEQYLNLLNQAGTMSETLEVTRAISDIRYSIESIESQLTSYDGQVDFSTITISLSEDESVSTVTQKWRPGSTVTDAFADWIVFLQGIVDKGVYGLIFGWPVLIIGFIWWRKRRR